MHQGLARVTLYLCDLSSLGLAWIVTMLGWLSRWLLIRNGRRRHLAYEDPSAPENAHDADLLEDDWLAL